MTLALGATREEDVGLEGYLSVGWKGQETLLVDERSDLPFGFDNPSVELVLARRDLELGKASIAMLLDFQESQRAVELSRPDTAHILD